MPEHPTRRAQNIGMSLTKAVMYGGVLMMGSNLVTHPDDITERPLRTGVVTAAYIYLLNRSRQGLVSYSSYLKTPAQRSVAQDHRHEATADWNSARLLGLAAVDFATATPEGKFVAAAFCAALGSYMLYSTRDHQRKVKALTANTQP